MKSGFISDETSLFAEEMSRRFAACGLASHAYPGLPPRGYYKPALRASGGYSSMARMVFSVTGEMMPFSVMMAVMREAGVMSKAGL
jgi:hypothetical protein